MFERSNELLLMKDQHFILDMYMGFWFSKKNLTYYLQLCLANKIKGDQ